MTPQEIREKRILEESKTIAIVGLSPKENRASNIIAKYLIAAGYTVIPVNTLYEEILGRKCRHSLLEIPEQVDIVDIFVRSEKVLPIVERAVLIKPRCIWLQLGIINEEAKRIAEAHNIPFFMDLCVKIEHTRLIAE